MSNADTITIRTALPADASAVHAMLLRLALAMGAPRKNSSSAKQIATALSGDTPAIHALIGEMQGKPVGVAVFFLTFSTWRGKPGVYVQDIYVAANARGAGLGKILLQAVAAWGLQQGADHLRLSVDPNNAAARAFYASVGLKLREDEVIYAATGESFTNLAQTP